MVKKRRDEIKLADNKYRERDPELSEKLLDIFARGVSEWNRWRYENQDVHINLLNPRFSDLNRHLTGINLSGASLHGADLSGADLTGADLSASYLYGANFQSSRLIEADLSGAHLQRADLNLARLTGADLRSAYLGWAAMTLATLDDADLSQANLHAAYMDSASLRGAILVEADLTDANLRDAKLSGADLSGANLSGASLVKADLSEAVLNNSRVYGISAWSLEIDRAEQKGLIITPEDEPIITVDNLKIAQFLYLLLNNSEIREVIDTITSKVVLILGRFTPDRKIILDAIRDELRKRDYTPVVFDFEKPANRNITETVSTLAHIARFVIADITDARSIPQELMRIIPDLPSVPVQPLLQASADEYGMFEHFKSYPWVLETFRYQDLRDVYANLATHIINPAEVKTRAR
jgi:uncharacterized protein YjbI with pentapeptide repeats